MDWDQFGEFKVFMKLWQLSLGSLSSPNSRRCFDQINCSGRAVFRSLSGGWRELERGGQQLGHGLTLGVVL